jgi:acyl-CoA hydrolase
MKEEDNMEFRSRRLVKYEDLNARGTLFGGQLLRCIDEEAAIYASCQLETQSIVTKYISEINFISPVKLGDVIEFGMEMVDVGRTSITFRCDVRNKFDKQTVVKIDKIVFVKIDENGRPTPHGLKKEDLS